MLARRVLVALCAAMALPGCQPEPKAAGVTATPPPVVARKAEEPPKPPPEKDYGTPVSYKSASDQIGDHYQTFEPKFWVRPGYRVTRVAENITGARFMEVDSAGRVYVAQPKQGKVVVLEPNGAGYRLAGEFLSDVGPVFFMLYREGWLYFTSPGKISRARNTGGDVKADEVEVVLDGLVEGPGHSFRALLMTDEHIYTALGDRGNITDETDSERQKIWRYDRKTKEKTLFASGLRNTEELAFRPGTQEIWGADHGSDRFGGPTGEVQDKVQPITDLNPPEELNLYVEGGFYGHPFLVGDRVPRYEHLKHPDLIALANKTIPPAWKYGAHWAANGFAFYEGSALPSDHRGDLFQALHGSWNRTQRAGYRVERVFFDKVTGLPYGSHMIVGTLSKTGERLARPVDVVVERRGTLLFSDDLFGAVYRIESTR